MSANNEVLIVKNLYFRYPGGDYVLKGVELEVSRGEHVLVIGDTGSGKTTLIRAITGLGTLLYRGEMAGEVYIAGVRLDQVTPEKLQRLVHVVGQNPYLFFTDYTVRDELYSYALRVYRDPNHAKRAVERAVETMNIWHLLDRYFYELSGGEARRVAVARALVADPVLLLFDEPLMWMDDHGVEDFKHILSLLRKLGKTVIVFEHRFLPILRLFDRVYLLERGVLVEVTNLVRDAIRHAHLERWSELKATHLRGSRVLVSLRGVSHSYDKPVLRGVDLDVFSDELIIIYGRNGSGKTTLLKIIAGYLKPTKGRVARACRVMYVPQNIPLFFTEETVMKEVESICKTWGRGVDCIKAGAKALQELKIPREASPFNLSHGQMVKLATTLSRLAGADLVLLDEPFSGLTYVDRLRLLEHLKSSGVAAVIATSSSDAVGSGIWSRAYELDEGVLKPLRADRVGSIELAARIYEEIKRGAGA